MHRVRLTDSGARSNEDVVLDDSCYGDSRAHTDESSATRALVDERIVDDVQIIARVRRAFAAVVEHGRVLRCRPLLYEVADDVRRTRVGEVDLVTLGAVGLAREPIVKNIVLLRAGLDEMANFGRMRIAVPQSELLNMTDIHVMRIAIAGAVARELG